MVADQHEIEGNEIFTRIQKADLRSDKDNGHSDGSRSVKSRKGVSKPTSSQGLAPSEDALRVIWAKRAEQLAQAIDDSEQDEQIELAVIRMGNSLYGLEVGHINEIRLVEQITRVPRVPAWVAGVVNLRGQIISVLDLYRYFNLPQEARNENHNDRYMVFCHTSSMELALLVDEVLAVIKISTNLFQEANGVAYGIQPEYIRGIAPYTQFKQNRKSKDLLADQAHETTKVEGGFVLGNHPSTVVIINLPVLLSDPKLIIHTEVTT